MKLKDPTLFRQACYINGKWTTSDAQAPLQVHNPATGEKVGEIPSLGAVETRTAIEAADKAFRVWRAANVKERSDILRKWYELILTHATDLAYLMTSEQGKPLKEAKGEVLYAASFVEWFAEEAKRVYGDIIPPPNGSRRSFALKQPVGVCAAITPWNFPSAMITRKTAPALAAGCTVVLKPAEQTPFSALALADLAERAGFPPGVFNVVTGMPEIIGAELTSHPKVRKVTFTGSTEVGKLLMKQSSDTVKKISLELGGHAPFIVFEDANLEAAIHGAVASKFRNMGQTCICANRFLVHQDVVDEFSEKFAKAAEALVVGNGIEQGTEQGPLIDEAALEKVELHIADATKKGAKVLAGGTRHKLGGTFFQPTVLSCATSEMRICREETFGPVAPILTFKSEEEAVRMANDTEFGLAAYFYTRNIGRAWRIAEELEYGMVGVNTGVISSEMTPFGGLKQSGIGREGSKYGIEEFLEIKYVCLGGLAPA